MSSDHEARLQALEWLVTRLTVAECLRRADPKVEAQKHVDASAELQKDLIQMVQDAGNSDAMLLAVIEGEVARAGLVQQIAAEVDASLA